VTIARACSNTYAGIRPADASGFIAEQTAGATLGAQRFGWLVPLRDGAAADDA
jgi:hypothetical protein